MKVIPFAAALTLMATTLSANEAEDVLRQFYADLQATPYDAATVAAYFADDYVDHTRPPFPPEMSDKAVILNIVESLATAVPDGTRVVSFTDPLGDDRVLGMFTFAGTHTGPFYDSPATGNAVIFRGVDIYRVENGQFVEHWHIEEVNRLIAQTSPE